MPGETRMTRKLIRLHLFDNARDVYAVNSHVPNTPVPGVYATTWWRMSEETARSCIGAEVHLHVGQKLPSYQAGRCTGYFPVAVKGCYGLLFVEDPALAGRVQLKHWAQVQARVYSDV